MRPAAHVLTQSWRTKTARLALGWALERAPPAGPPFVGSNLVDDWRMLSTAWVTGGTFLARKETSMRHGVLTVGFAFAALAVFMSAPVLAADMHQGKVVKAGDGKLTMTDTAGKNEHTHEVAPTAAVTCEGKTCGLVDVKAGDMVTVTTATQEGKTVATKIEAKKAGS